jgi:hypothetical protein
MLRCLINLFRRPPVGTSALLHRRDYDRTSTKNAQFVSFLDESGFRRGIDSNKYEASMRRRRVAAYVLLGMMVAGFAWVVIESAQALSIF